MKAFVLLLCCLAVAWPQTPAPGDYRISGVVVDHLTNQPLGHVLVQILRTGTGGGDASVLTGDNGQFAFLHLPTGKYRITAQKRGQMPQPLHPDGIYATAIVVDGKQNTDGIVFDMRTDASISGTVTGDDGDPVRNAQVSLLRDLVNNGEPQTTQVKGSNTNSAGHFHFGHLDAGRYYIAVSATPWIAMAAQVNTVYPVTFYGDTADGESAQAIILLEGGAANVAINLRTAPGIHVKLAEGTNGASLFVAGPGGSRVPSMAMFRGSGNNTQSYIRRGRPTGIPQINSLQGGSMELTNLPAGRYEVIPAGENGGNGEASETVDLADGSTLDLDHMPATSISGRVLVDGPLPKGDIQVFLGRGRGGSEAEVAADGTFKFPRTGAGNYDIRLNASGLAIASVTATGARIVQDKVQLAPGAAAELTIKAVPRAALANLDGVATRNGTGVPGVMVLLLPDNLAHARLIRRDQSDGDGSFTLPDVLPGKYMLVAIENGHDLAYKTPSVIQPYLAQGVPVTVPSTSNEPLRVPVQARPTRPSPP